MSRILVETKSQFAERMGVSKSTVTRWGHADRLVINTKGLVIVRESIARIEETRAGRLDMEAHHAAHRGHGLQRTGADINIPAQDIPDGPGDHRTELTRRRIEIENKTIQIQLDLEDGIRLLRNRVREGSYAIGGAIRASIESLIDELAPVLIANDTDEARRSLIQAAVQRVKKTVESDVHRLTRHLREQRDEE